MRTVIAVVFCLLATPCWSWPARVDRVIDGDTLVVQRDRALVKIRLFGIDAPEHDQPGGSQSKQALRSMVKGQALDVLPVDRDRYGRTVARLAIHGSDVGTMMVRAGQAWQFTRYDHGRTLKQAEERARREGVGVWSGRDPQPPWLWRHHERSQPPAAKLARCDSPLRCSAMTTCNAVRGAVARCGMGQLDGDHDGVPCESLCRPTG